MSKNIKIYLHWNQIYSKNLRGSKFMVLKLELEIYNKIRPMMCELKKIHIASNML